MRERRNKHLVWIVIGAASLAGLASSSATRSLAQSSAMPILLQITSPAGGTVVHPGQTVTIVAAPTSGDSFVKVYVGGSIGNSQPLSAPPYQLSLTIPQKIAAGKYAVSAFGTRPGQNAGTSAPIDLDVEPAASISKITVKPTVILFRKPGERDNLRVIGTFQDGSTMDITHSTGTTYTSGDTARVTADSNGIVTAVSGGQDAPTGIDVQYGGQLFQVSAITKSLPPPGD